MYQGLYGLTERKEELEPVISSQSYELNKVSEKLKLYPWDWTLRHEYNHHSSYLYQAKKEYNRILKGKGQFKHMNGWYKKRRIKRQIRKWSIIPIK